MNFTAPPPYRMAAKPGSQNFTNCVPLNNTTMLIEPLKISKNHSTSQKPSKNILNSFPQISLKRIVRFIHCHYFTTAFQQHQNKSLFHLKQAIITSKTPSNHQDPFPTSNHHPKTESELSLASACIQRQRQITRFIHLTNLTHPPVLLETD